MSAISQIAPAFLLQQRREPAELIEVLIQVGIILVIVAIPIARAIFESVKRRAQGPQPPPRPRPRPERGGGARPEGLDVFEQLLRGELPTGEPRTGEPRTGEPRTGERAGAPATPVRTPRHRPPPARAPLPEGPPFEASAPGGPGAPPPPFGHAADVDPEGRAADRWRQALELDEAEQAEQAALAEKLAGPRRRAAQRERAARERAELAERAAAEAAEAETLARLEVERARGAPPTRAGPRRRPRSLFARGRTREEWRDAILAVEILGTPVALRDPRRGPGSFGPRGD